MQAIVDVHFPGLRKELLAEGARRVLRRARTAGAEEEAVDVGTARLAEAAGGRADTAGGAALADDKLTVPPLAGALLKNEQDMHLFERLVFMARNSR
jgi:hypothetical protein